MEISRLDQFIVEYENVFTEWFCQDVIDFFESNSNLLEYHNTDGYKFRQLNVNQANFNLAKYFCQQIVDLADDYFERVHLTEFKPKFAFEEVRIKRYDANCDEFKTHVDVVDHASAKRFLVFILYLNDNNGTTEFPQLGVSITPKKGNMVAFPAHWQYPHKGNVPTDKNKYILMTSLVYI